jgi:hypothetical protein
MPQDTSLVPSALKSWRLQREEWQTTADYSRLQLTTADNFDTYQAQDLVTMAIFAAKHTHAHARVDVPQANSVIYTPVL